MLRGGFQEPIQQIGKRSTSPESVTSIYPFSRPLVQQRGVNLCGTRYRWPPLGSPCCFMVPSKSHTIGTWTLKSATMNGDPVWTHCTHTASINQTLTHCSAAVGVGSSLPIDQPLASQTQDDRGRQSPLQKNTHPFWFRNWSLNPQLSRNAPVLLCPLTEGDGLSA